MSKHYTGWTGYMTVHIYIQTSCTIVAYEKRHEHSMYVSTPTGNVGTLNLLLHADCCVYHAWELDCTW